MTPRTLARLLGYGGLLPFALSAGAIFAFGPRSAFAYDVALVAYGAVILSFVGAVHWGRSLERGQHDSAGLYLVSVLPALVGWVALLLPARLALPVLVAAFGLVLAFERSAGADDNMPHWYATLRVHLTLGAMLLLMLGWVALGRHG